MCNERSPVKIDECHLWNRGFQEYPCFSQFEGIMENCGQDLFEPMFEMYKVRLMAGHYKPQGHSRLQTFADLYGSTKDKKVLHY